jgi:ferritin-like metal-binding protein YciE
MPIKDPKELFVWMLSDLRQGAERSTQIFQELAQIAQDPDVKEALEARVFVHEKILSTLDECFRRIGQKAVNTRGKLHEAFVEDFRREVAEIESKETRRLFILSKANRLVHMRMADYEALIGMADLTGHYAVASLLESCLADQTALVERARRLIRQRVEQRLAGGLAGN